MIHGPTVYSDTALKKIHKPTLADVAREAQCSPKAASQALQHGIGSASLITRVRVAVEALGYTIVSKRRDPYNIFIISPISYNPDFYAEICDVLTQTFYRANPELQIIHLNSENITMDKLSEMFDIDIVIKQGAAGVVLLTPVEPHGAVRLALSGIPVVVVGYSDGLDYNYDLIRYIKIDSSVGVKEAMNYLIGVGHSRIGFIKGHPSAESSVQRYDAYLSELQTNDRTDNLLYSVGIGSSQPRFATGYTAGKELLGRTLRPTAIIAYNDAMALGCLRACLDAGLNIPRDISIIGSENLPFSDYVTPSLSTMAFDIDTLCTHIVSFFEYRGVQSDSSDRIVRTHFINRDSAGPHSSP